MTLLDRYIAKTVLQSIGLVSLMLIGLQIFILFVNQLGDLGKLDYGIKQAAFFVLLQLPYEVYLFFPMASLLGCLIGLGMLANHSELVVMRAVGLSIGQITLAVVKAALVLVLVVTILAETLVPSFSHYANDYKAAALSAGQSIRTAQGVWLRQGADFISIGAVLPKDVIQDIYQFRFNAQHELVLTRAIAQARFENNAWTAYDVRQTQLSTKHIEAENKASMPWDVRIKPQILKISRTQPDEMSLPELYQYLKEQKSGHQSTHSYQLAFLQRLIQPVTTLVMILLAVPFIFGPLRSTPIGSKLLAGVTVGFSFHILNHFFGPVSLVFQWPVVLAAIGPTLVFALLGLYLTTRMR
jgi:lipopolysaccharide export system permease protein